MPNLLIALMVSIKNVFTSLLSSVQAIDAAKLAAQEEIAVAITSTAVAAD
jgi:hypothetical protein